jgi:CREB3 regulatory factor
MKSKVNIEQRTFEEQINIDLDDPSSPSCTIEQPSEPDLWSDIEQNSSDLMHDNDNGDDDDDDVDNDDEEDDDDNTSDDETTTTTSASFNTDRNKKQSSPFNSNATSPFWQYNVQAKGPKTKRVLYLKERDPHLFREFSDPVYQIKLTQTRGQTLTKLRKGDGNDVTPNPLKLYQLGKQIRDLSGGVGKSNGNTSSVYHGIYHFEPQTNINDTAEVKKEKNKIASR